MPLPADAVSIAEPMDPTDLINFEADFKSRLTGDGEEIASYTIALLPDATLAGVEIVEGGGRDPVLIEDNSVIQFWLQVDPGSREDPAFSGAGMTIGVVGTIETTAAPLKRWQRTFKISARQR